MNDKIPQKFYDPIGARNAQIQELQSELKRTVWIAEQLIKNRIPLSSAEEEIELIKARNFGLFDI